MAAVSIDTLGQLDRADFTRTLGGIFEHSPWVAERAWARGPFSGIDELHQAMVAVVAEASPQEQLALLRAHPELAGREARAGELTAESTGEQASVGLNALTSEELAQTARLNAAYRERFGFPFIIAVRRNTKDAIFHQWRERLNHTPEQERATALEQVAIIARLRLDTLLG